MPRFWGLGCGVGLRVLCLESRGVPGFRGGGFVLHGLSPSFVVQISRGLRAVERFVLKGSSRQRLASRQELGFRA